MRNLILNAIARLLILVGGASQSLARWLRS
jgi:hypothetical protein